MQDTFLSEENKKDNHLINHVIGVDSQWTIYFL